MKKFLLIILLISTVKLTDSIKFNSNTVYKIDEISVIVSRWDLLIKQIIKVESANNHPNYQIGDGGKAIGPMQIHKIMVDECNRLQDSINYTYKDRWDLNKSINIFNIYQDYWNPEHDLELALSLWNGGSKMRDFTLAYLTEDYVNKFKL